MTDTIFEYGSDLPLVSERAAKDSSDRIAAERRHRALDRQAQNASLERARGNRSDKILVSVAVGILALVAAAEGASYLTQPRGRTITEVVQAGENPWTLASRAEKTSGSDPADFNIRAEASRIAQEDGPVLSTGETVKVHIK